MPYQFPLVVRYDDEGQPNGLKESNTISASSVSATDIIVESLSATGDFVVSSISATTIKVNYISAIQELIVSSISAIDWLGLPVAGGAVSITDASVGAIYFRSGDSAVSSIPLPITSGYLFVDYDGINPLYSFEPAVGLSMADLDALSATIASIYVSSSELTGFATTTDISNLSTTIASVYVSSSELTAYATDADITNLSATIASIYVSGSQLDSLATDTELANSISNLSTTISTVYASSIQLQNLQASTAQISAAVTTIDSTHVAYTDAQSNNAIYFRLTENSASGIAPSTGYLRWDGSKYVWETPAGGVTVLDNLNDVSVPSPQPDQALVYKDGEWVASSISTLDAYLNLQASTQSISTLVTTINNNYVSELGLGTGSIYYGTAENTVGILPIGSNGQVLVVATNIPNWVNSDDLPIAGTLDTKINSLSTTVSNNYVSSLQLSAYVPLSAATTANRIYFRTTGNVASAIVAPVTAGTFLKYDNNQFEWGSIPAPVLSLNDLNDVVSVGPAVDAVLVYSNLDGGGWVASSISTIDIFQNLQASTQDISTVVNTIFNNYATDTELTNSINALSTVISSTYVSASQLAAYATDTELTNSINSLSALISSTYVSSSELSLYATDTDITNLSTTIANNYVSSAGDVMTGFLTFNGSYGIKFEDIAGLGGLSANNKIVFYSPTEGLSAAQIKSYTNETVGVSAPFIATNTSFSGYHYNNTTPNQEVPVATYLRQLDKWLYLHVENYNNPTGDATVGHWSVAGIRDKSLNILSATDASALKDINYPTTPSNGQVLTWDNTAWVNKTQASALSALTTDVLITSPIPTIGLVLKWNGSKWTPQKDLGSIFDPTGETILDPENDIGDATYENHLLMFGSSIGDILATYWHVSSIDLHLGNIDQVDGTEIHHYLSSLDQRYLPISGLVSAAVAVEALTGVDYIEFDLNANVTREEGRLYWNDTYKTLELDSSNQTSIFLGQEVVVRVLNNTAQTFTRGQVVYISGTESNIPTIALATASAEATTHKGLGVLKQTLGPTDRGLMSIFGKVSGIDTSIYNIGDILYLGTTPGSLTNVYSPAPSHPELIGSVVTVGTSSTGVVLVQVQHGYEIQELHNVSRTPASATGQVLVWNNTSGYYAPGSHNDLAGLTTGNPHTQYATLSGCNFTGTVSATTVSATTYQNIPKQVRPISINIENPSANMIIPLFYGEGYIDTINQINSVIIGGTSATWSIYETADVADSSNVLNPVLYENEVTDSTTAGNSHPTNVTFSENWIVLVIKSVSGAISRLHLTVFVS